DIHSRSCDVRFTPKSRHPSVISTSALCEKWTCCKALTNEQSEPEKGPAQNRSEGSEGQGRIHKLTRSAFFGAATKQRPRHGDFLLRPQIIFSTGTSRACAPLSLAGA